MVGGSTNAARLDTARTIDAAVTGSLTPAPLAIIARLKAATTTTT